MAVPVSVKISPFSMAGVRARELVASSCGLVCCPASIQKTRGAPIAVTIGRSKIQAKPAAAWVTQASTEGFLPGDPGLDYPDIHNLLRIYACRIAFEDDKISVLSRLQRPDAVTKADLPRRVDRHCA